MSESETSTGKPGLVVRAVRALVGASLVSALAFSITMFSAWLEYRGDSRYQPRGYGNTLVKLRYLRRTIDDHVERQGSAPRSLRELPTHTGFMLDEEGRESRYHVDGWGREFRYVIDDSGYTVSSLGRDGEPGGIGIDYDLSTNDLDRPPRSARLTAYQFFRFGPTREIAWICGLGVAMVFVLCSFLFFGVDPQQFGRANRLSYYAIVTVASLAAAGFMATFHLSSKGVH